MSKSLVWPTALLLTAVVAGWAGCGGSTGAAGTPGAPAAPGVPGVPGVPGTPAPGTAPDAVNLLSAASYALTTSAGLTATIGIAAGVPNSASFGGNVAMDAPTSTCTSTSTTADAAVTGQDSCGLSTGVDITNPAVNTAGGLAITGTTIRYNPGTTPNSDGFNASVRGVKNDVNTAWNDASSRIGGALIPGLGALDGRVLPPGVYNSASTMTLGSGETLTLDAGAGNANAANAVWIFQVGSSLTVTGSTAACSSAPVVCTPTQVKLINGALAKNVFWQVGTPTTGAENGTVRAADDIVRAENGTVSFPAATGPVQNNTVFKGTILAGSSVTFAGGTALEGRVLAGADLLGTPNTQTGGAVTTTGGSTGAVTVTLPL